MNDIFERNYQKGQALLLSVILLGGVMIGATAIAGIVMLYAIRTAPQVSNSAKAIYAADAGLEWELYRYYVNLGAAAPTFTNGSPNAPVTVSTCSFNDADGSGANTGKCLNAPDQELSMRSLGKAGPSSREVRRAFELTFTPAP